jgi:hypothetical protein
LIRSRLNVVRFNRSYFKVGNLNRVRTADRTRVSPIGCLNLRDQKLLPRLGTSLSILAMMLGAS